MSLIEETDFGTPRSTSGTMVTLTIDGQSITVPEGTSIMRAAMEAGTQIPKLCATDMVDAFGSCRLCLIEIEGRAGTPASCTTPVAEGMVVHTKSERLDRIRKGVMELYVSDHSVDSLDRSKYADVDLLDTAAEVGLEEVRYGFAGARHRNPGIDDSNPYFTFDPAKCIVCSRCVRACEEVQGTFALTISGRGFDSIVAAGMDPESLPMSDPSKMSFGTDASGERAKPKAWKEIWGSGQGVGSIGGIVPAAELIARLRQEYDEAKDQPL